MKLDHFVVHVDNDLPQLNDLAKKINPMGFPFRPKKGKGTSGFKASNIWIGDQYFEIVRLMKKEGGGWPSEWVERYNNKERGLSCIFLAVNNLNEIYERLKSLNIDCAVETTEFKVLFGLSKMVMPWKYIKLPPIPSTQIDIRFIEYEQEGWGHYQKYMKPNSRDFGIEGIFDSEIFIKNFDEGINYLQKIFPNLEKSETQAVVELQEGKMVFLPHQNQEKSVRLISRNNKNSNASWSFLNFEVVV